MNSDRQFYYSGPRHLQGGMATLILILVVLLGLTAVTFYAANSGLTKQRIAANENRAKEAFEAAEVGTNLAINYVQRNTAILSDPLEPTFVWSLCADASVPCGDGTTQHFDANYVYYNNGGSTMLPISDPNPAAAADPPYQVALVAKCVDADVPPNGCDAVEPSLSDNALFVAVAQGQSLDRTGNALVHQAFKTTKALGQAPDAPLIAINNVNLSGSIEIVANPNGGGPGVPLSAWTKSEVTIGASAYTCYPGEYLASGNPVVDAATGVELCQNTAGAKCTCSSASETGQISSNGLGENEDIVDNVNPFPDLFAYVFGIPRDQYRDIKDMADVRGDCSGLGPTSSGLIWIEGPCNVTGAPSDRIGTPANPVLLVVEDAVLQMNGQEIFGMVYLFDLNEDGAGASLSANGNCQVYGAIVAEGSVPHTVGTFIVRYEETVLSNLVNSSDSRGVGRLPGTWLDYL